MKEIVVTMAYLCEDIMFSFIMLPLIFPKDAILNLSVKANAARGKFVSSAKVLAAVSSILQQRSIYCELYMKTRINFKLAGKQLSTMTEIQSFGRAFSRMVNRNLTLSHF